MSICLSLLTALSFLTAFILQEEKPAISERNRIRIAEAFRLADNLGDKIWEGWNEIPFAVLLVTPDHEFLIRHPKPSNDFTSLGYDSLLGSEVFSRKRVFQLNFLATFPAVSGIPTIVVGTPENTSTTSTAWVVTLLHEHFHQLQMSEANYQTDVATLDLSRGDETGMWMLNFPFPYDSSEVKERFAELVESLYDGLQAVGREDFSGKLNSYLEMRRRFQSVLPPDDYRYFSFQLWQEGIARYTEYRVAEQASRKFQPSKKFASLPDFKPFKEVAISLFTKTLSELRNADLRKDKRLVFYSVGAVEGLLLDEAKPQWKKNYFAEKFFLEKYFPR